MPALPSYYLDRPGRPTPEAEAAFADLYDRHVSAGAGDIDYRLTAPKWQFLCWLADHRDVVLHGSTADIAEFEPRQPADSSEFGNRSAVFAASDGIWAMFFAILDRSVAWSLVNACFSVWPHGDGGQSGEVPAPHYYFSVNADALAAEWATPGYVYVLPRNTFERQPESSHEGEALVWHQWASLEPVRPLARLAVEASDFPFLADVNGHDVAVVSARAAADPEAFPWRD